MPQPIFYRRPETVRIDLSNGGWIIVKKYLTAGETRKLFQRMMRRGATSTEIDPLNIGVSKCVIYLVDWSVIDAEGNPVMIRNQSEEYIAAALDSMDADAFAIILRAVEAHEEAMEQAREEEKKILTGLMPSNPILPSPDSLVGATNG